MERPIHTTFMHSLRDLIGWQLAVVRRAGSGEKGSELMSMEDKIILFVDDREIMYRERGV